MTRKYDSTVARIAGNLLSGNPYLLSGDEDHDRQLVAKAVACARFIVMETERTELPRLPTDPPSPPQNED